MNVGIYLANYSQNVGGGYTFQNDILKSLVELAGESKHTFTLVLNQHEDIIMISDADQLGYITYAPDNLIERVFSRINRIFPGFRRFRNSLNRFDRIVKDAGIEFVWFVSNTGVETDLPFLTTVWDLQHRLQPWFPEISMYGEWYDREDFFSWFLQRASNIIVGTEAGKLEVERLFQIPEERITILPHPTPSDTLECHEVHKNEVLNKFGIPDSYLFYPAQFWAHKNHANLLLAVKELSESYNLDLPIVFAGSDRGNLNFVMQLSRELDLADRSFFLGYVSRRDLISLYRNAFALTYMTFFGPENLPPLEAFALGCPVIASNVSGANEQLGDAALLVDPKCPKEIAQAIKNLHDKPNLREDLIYRGSKRASIWTGKDFVRGVFSILDEFEAIRRCWGN